VRGLKISFRAGAGRAERSPTDSISALFLDRCRALCEACEIRNNLRVGLLFGLASSYAPFPRKQSSKLIGLIGGFKERALHFHAQKHNNNGAEQCWYFSKLPWHSFPISWSFPLQTDDILPVIKSCRQSGNIVTAGTPAIIITKLNAAMD
jgi:hypothetical protein